MVIDSPQGNVFLRSDWLRMLEETSKTDRILALGCYDDNRRLLGGQTLQYRIQSGLRVAVPFEFFYSGPILAPCRVKSHARREAREHRVITSLLHGLEGVCDIIEFETHPTFGDIRPYIFAGWQHKVRYTHILDLTDLSRAYRDMAQTKRSGVRRANERLTLKPEDSAEAIDTFVSLYRGTMVKFDWWPSPEWEATFRARMGWLMARDACRLYTARDLAGEPVAMTVFVLSQEDGTVYGWRAAATPAADDLAASPAIYWHAARDFTGSFHAMNLGGSPTASLDAFKTMLGARAHPHFAVGYEGRPIAYRTLRQTQRLKDSLWRMVMRPAGQLVQRLRHGHKDAHG
jgi:hypothetical protein